MKCLVTIFLVIAVCNNIKAQITYIPDAVFEQVLIDLDIDSDGSINGQILTSDALSITELIISPIAIPNYPYAADNYYDGFIHDLTGIEAFVNLQDLTIHVTMVEELNLSNLINLKYLDCVDNMLTSLDVSHNVLLEYLDITSGGDVLPFNDFTEIDLSSNPNIQTLKASGVGNINLNNNNNNSDMFIIISCNYCWSYPSDYIHGNVCIEVDNVPLAQNNQYPYSEWIIYDTYMTYSYTEDAIQCSLNIDEYQKIALKLYPNPASDILMLEIVDDTLIDKIIIFDELGRVVMEQDQVGNNINISKLQSGIYILKAFTAKGNITKKILIN